MIRTLDVLIHDRLVGALREENDLWQFEYSQEWCASPHGFDLSPALPREPALHADGASDRPVQWYFDNLLPEEAMRTVLTKEARLGADDAFALLAYYGSESAGAIVLRPPGTADEPEHGLRPLSPAELNLRIGSLPNVSLMHDLIGAARG